MSWSPFRDAATRARWRKLLMQRQVARCALCGYHLPEAGAVTADVYAGFAPTFDHIVPRAHGGEDTLGNLRLVHRACNHKRGEADGLERIPPIPRSLRIEPGRRYHAYICSSGHIHIGARKD